MHRTDFIVNASMVVRHFVMEVNNNVVRHINGNVPGILYADGFKDKLAGRCRTIKKCAETSSADVTGYNVRGNFSIVTNA